jgi:hypothetical protein
MDAAPANWSPGKTAAETNRLIIERKCRQTADCMICLEPMYNAVCEHLPCTHVFHYKCLGRLMASRTYTCPLCRANFSTTLAGAGLIVLPALAETEGEAEAVLMLNQIELYFFIFELLWHTSDSTFAALIAE